MQITAAAFSVLCPQSWGNLILISCFTLCRSMCFFFYHSTEPSCLAHLPRFWQSQPFLIPDLVKCHFMSWRRQTLWICTCVCVWMWTYPNSHPWCNLRAVLPWQIIFMIIMYINRWTGVALRGPHFSNKCRNQDSGVKIILSESPREIHETCVPGQFQHIY